MTRMRTVLWAALLALTLSIGVADQAWPTAATKDANTPLKTSLDLKAYPVAASTTIYKGTMVAINTAGYAVPAADTANFIVVGLADAKADNSTGAAGDLNVKVRLGVALMGATSLTQAMVGTQMYVVDDQTFDDGYGTNNIAAGVLVEYVSSTKGWVAFGVPPNPGMGKLAAGVGMGYRIARGTVTLDGSNPTPVSHGLTTVEACTLTHKTTSAPGLDPVGLTYDVSAGNLNIYAWKFTSAGDPTLIASTNSAAVIAWDCGGE